MATDEEIKKIINDTLEERKKRTVGKVFRDPVKAEAICYIFGVLFFVTLVVSIILSTSGSSSSFYNSSDNADVQYMHIVLSHSSCQELKSTFADLNHKSGKAFSNIEYAYQNEILARC